MKKTLSIIMSVLIIVLCTSCSGLSDKESFVDDSAASSDSATESSKIKSIEARTESAQTMRKGEKLEFDFDFDADGSVKDEDVKVVIKDESVIELDSIEIHNILDYFEVTVSALNYGNTTIQITSANGVVKSAEIPINVPKELESAEISGESTIKLSVGESRSVSGTLKPTGLTEKEVTVISNSSDAVEVKDVKFKSENDSTILTFTLLGKKTQYSSVYISVHNAFDETLASLEVEIKEQPTDPPTTVAPPKPVESSSKVESSDSDDDDDDYYVNNNDGGSSHTYILNTNTKKFHYPSCSSVNKMAEKNKQEYSGTRDEVIAMGYDPCQKCCP